MCKSIKNQKPEILMTPILSTIYIEESKNESTIVLSLIYAALIWQEAVTKSYNRQKLNVNVEIDCIKKI